MSKIKNWFKSQVKTKIDDNLRKQIINEYRNSDQYIKDIQADIDWDWDEMFDDLDNEELEKQEKKKDKGTEKVKQLEQEISKTKIDLKSILTKGVKDE